MIVADRLAKVTAGLGVLTVAGAVHGLVHGDMVGAALFGAATLLFGVATVLGVRS